MNSLSNSCSRFNKKVRILFDSSKELILVVRCGKAQNNGYSNRKTLYGIKADRGRDFHLLADHMTKFEISPTAKFVGFQRFHFHYN